MFIAGDSEFSRNKTFLSNLDNYRTCSRQIRLQKISFVEINAKLGVLWVYTTNIGSCCRCKRPTRLVRFKHKKSHRFYHLYVLNDAFYFIINLNTTFKTFIVIVLVIILSTRTVFVEYFSYDLISIMLYNSSQFS